MQTYVEHGHRAQRDYCKTPAPSAASAPVPCAMMRTDDVPSKYERTVWSGEACARAARERGGRGLTTTMVRATNTHMHTVATRTHANMRTATPTRCSASRNFHTGTGPVFDGYLVSQFIVVFARQSGWRPTAQSGVFGLDDNRLVANVNDPLVVTELTKYSIQHQRVPTII